MNWKVLLKIIAVGAASGGLGAAAQALQGSGIDLVPAVAAIVTVIAYLLKTPLTPKTK